MSNNILMMNNRQLVPRWHTSRKLFKFNYPIQDEKLIKSHFDEDYWFKKSVEEWKSNPNRFNTIDVFVRLIQEDERSHPLFNQLHRVLLDQYDDLPCSIQNVVCPNLKFTDKLDGYSTSAEGVRLIISKLKSIVNVNPRDSLTWMDLGFYYSVIGEINKAEHYTKTAKNLDPHNTFIARAYSRFLVHIGDPEQAIWYLKNLQNLKTNPMILSAYTAISTAFDIGKPNIKKAMSLVESWDGDRSKISELSACLGTIEIQNGSIQKGKKHIQLALNSPSENVIAHVKWLHHKHHLNFKNMPDFHSSIEGGVNDLYSKKMFSECRDKLVEMHQFQPYSSGPIVDAGYLSIVALKDAQFVIDASNNRISKSHMGFGELNNLIVAKVMQNQIVDIDVDLRLLARKVNTDDLHSVATFKATAGMLLIEGGMIEEGEKLYDESISLLKRNNLNRSLCVASYFYSETIKNISPEKSMALRKESTKLAKQYAIHEVLK